MPAPQAPDLKVTLDRTRAFWHARQGLARSPADDPAEVVARTGWARTLGGVDVYFAVRARRPGLERAALDAAVRRGELRVAPAARGCIYLVPERDVPLAAALAADLSRPRTERELAKAGSSWDEVDAVAVEVRKTLAGGPETTAGIRKALPVGAVRSLGEAGKKVGLSSPLPVALRELEFRGEIERRPVGGVLDTERYEWRLAEKPLAEKYRVPGDREARLAAVAHRFFEHFGPASTRELATWAGASLGDAKAAVAKLPLARVAIEGRHDAAWILAEDREELAGAAPPPAAFSFLAFEDNLLTVHGGPGVLTDPAHHGFPVARWGSSKPASLGEARHVANRPLLSGGKIAGFWEFDADAAEVVAGTFEPLSGARRRALREQCESLAAFIRDELGHARSFSLDTDEKVRARAAAVREMS